MAGVSRSVVEAEVSKGEVELEVSVGADVFKRRSRAGFRM